MGSLVVRTAQIRMGSLVGLLLTGAMGREFSHSLQLTTVKYKINQLTTLSNGPT